MLKRILALMLVVTLLFCLIGLQAAAQGKGGANGAPRPATQAQLKSASGIPEIIAEGENGPPFGPPENGDGNSELGVTRRNTNRHEVLVNERGSEVEYSRVVEAGNFLIPMRALSVALQADLEWNEDTGELSITRNGDVKVITISEEGLKYNNEVLDFEKPPWMLGDKFVVLPRFLAGLFVEEPE